MTYLALNLSHYVNGVAKKHGEISRLMFAGYTIDAITNGVHAASWTADAFAQLYDRYIPGGAKIIEPSICVRYTAAGDLAGALAREKTVTPLR